MHITDGPFSGTGFSEESRHVLFRLAKKGFKISWLALQHFGMKYELSSNVFPDLPKNVKIQVLGNFGNPMGSDACKVHYLREVPDLVMFMGDPNRIGSYMGLLNRVPFPFGLYATLDGLPVHPSLVHILKNPNLDFTITMTKWATIEYAKAGVISNTFIHHGTNTSWWKSTEKERLELRHKYKIPEDAVVFINWDTNQYRKRLDTLLRCWKRFKPENKNAILILYTDWNLTRLGWGISDLIKQYNVPRKTIRDPVELTDTPKYFENAERPEQLREIALLGDVYVSTSGGEGFGKCNLDAQACGMPVIATNYSAIPEVVGNGGILVPITNTFRMHDQAKVVELGMVDEEKFTDAMEKIYYNESLRKELSKSALENAEKFDYDKVIIPKWIETFKRVNPDEILMKKVLRHA